MKEILLDSMQRGRLTLAGGCAAPPAINQPTLLDGTCEEREPLGFNAAGISFPENLEN